MSELDPEPGSEILRESGHGVVCGNTEAEIRAGALEILAREARGERPVPTDRFSWQVMVDRVVDLVDSDVFAGPPAAQQGSGRASVEPELIAKPLRVGAGTAVLLRGTIDPALIGGPLRVEIGSQAAGVAELSVGHRTRPGDVLWWCLLPVTPPVRPGVKGVHEVRLVSDGRSHVVGEIEVLASPPPEAVPTERAEPLIAICMATYEPDPGLLRRQIDSIRAQDRDGWICMISDDASSPEAVAVIEELITDDDRFVLSRSPERLGFYANFERALRMVPPEAELVALCDQDDRWYEDKLSTLVSCLERQPAATLAYSDMRVVDEDGRAISDTFWDQSTNAYEAIDTLAIINTVAGGAAMFRREVLDLAMPFPPGFSSQHYHDHWLALCALALGDLTYVHHPTYDYTRHSESITVSASRQMSEPARGVVERGLNGVRVMGRRLRLATESGSSPEAFFARFLMLEQYVAVLRMRDWERITPAKRRSLELIARADSSPRAFAWLVGRTLRPALGHRETLGRERVLIGGLIWRRRARRQAERRESAAAKRELTKRA